MPPAASILARAPALTSSTRTVSFFASFPPARILTSRSLALDQAPRQEAGPVHDLPVGEGVRAPPAFTVAYSLGTGSWRSRGGQGGGTAASGRPRSRPAPRPRPGPSGPCCPCRRCRRARSPSRGRRSSCSWWRRPACGCRNSSYHRLTSSTSTRCATARTMPSMAGVASCSVAAPSLLKPSAVTVLRQAGLLPIGLRTR